MPSIEGLSDPGELGPSAIFYCPEDKRWLRPPARSLRSFCETRTYRSLFYTGTRIHSLPRVSETFNMQDMISTAASQNRRLHIPLEEANKALDTYLEVVDLRFPRLPVAKVKSGIAAIAATDDAAYQDKLSNSPGHIFTAYIVLAVVPLSSDNCPISQGSFVSIHVLAKCLKGLDRVFNQEDGVNIIQCLHLLVIFSNTLVVRACDSSSSSNGFLGRGKLPYFRAVTLAP